MKQHLIFIVLVAGLATLTVCFSKTKVEDETLPDWTLLHKISRDRHNYRSNLLKIDGMIQRFTHLNGKETHFLFDEGFKTADQVLEKIQEVIAGALSGEAPGLL